MKLQTQRKYYRKISTPRKNKYIGTTCEIWTVTSYPGPISYNMDSHQVNHLSTPWLQPRRIAGFDRPSDGVWCNTTAVSDLNRGVPKSESNMKIYNFNKTVKITTKKDNKAQTSLISSHYHWLEFYKRHFTIFKSRMS